jgi:hypothetical protein
LNPKVLTEERIMRVRPLEVWVFTLLVAMVGVGVYHQYLANERAKAPAAPFSMTVKAPPR